MNPLVSDGFGHETKAQARRTLRVEENRTRRKPTSRCLCNQTVCMRTAELLRTFDHSTDGRFRPSRRISGVFRRSVDGLGPLFAVGVSNSGWLTSQRSWRIGGCCDLGLWDISDLNKEVMAGGCRRWRAECRVGVNRRRKRRFRCPLLRKISRYENSQSIVSPGRPWGVVTLFLIGMAWIGKEPRRTGSALVLPRIVVPSRFPRSGRVGMRTSCRPRLMNARRHGHPKSPLDT
jgi:hypothetical protein